MPIPAPTTAARPMLAMLLVVLLALPAVAHAAPRARFQDAACPCEHCVQAGNTVAKCESFGSDCACYKGCPCATCVAAGNTVATCAGYGSDCACYSDEDGGAGHDNGGGEGGACADFGDRTQALNDECCDEVTED
eukprot:COSAG06_NODE_33035_length_496_cov_1.095718_1_plen_134_part_01